MKNLINWQRMWPHLIVIIGFIALALMYVSPVLQGRKLNMHDDIQAKAAAREVVVNHEKTGEWSAWTNSMFGGMPTYMIASDYPASISTKIGRAVNSLLPAPANYLLIGLISAYILFLSIGAGIWVSAIGAVSFAFASFNLISLEAGHVSKVIAIMYAPGVLAGVILAFRKNWLVGAAVTALFLSLELYANHVQITYYLGIGVAFLVLVESMSLLRKGETKRLGMIIAGLFLAVTIAVSNHTTRLWNAYDYTKETIRGKPELTPLGDPGQGGAKQNGLDKEYAFSYSYGIGETLTMIIPNAYGGSSMGALDANSETYKVLVNKGIDPASAQNVIQQLPLYWGDQPIMGGPAYVGALVFFFFVLGMFIVKGPIKNWTVGIIILYIIWGWGKNFELVNYAFFDYFPMFNKFRAMTMVVALTQMLMVFLGVMGLAKIIQRKITWKELEKPFLITLGITGGLTLILSLVPSLLFNFQSVNDMRTVESFAQMTQDQAFAQQIMNGIVQDRAGLMKADAFRTLIFILLTAGVVWLWMKEMIKPILVYVSLLLLVVIDLFGVGKRYLNNEDFVSSYAIDANFNPTPADEQILQDTDPDFKVYDVSTSPFQSANASYLHKSLGGYHGAKLRRYQEVFERQVFKAQPNFGILNMLNTKYIITADEKGNKIAQRNPDALGHAWFVNKYTLVPNADAEMAALDSLKPKEEAVLDQKFAGTLKGLVIQPDSSAQIKLTSYKPDELKYESNSNAEGLAVFAEIYYNVNNEWKVTIDGKPADLLRANYIVRALRVPQGKHEIVFKFEPVSIVNGSKIDFMSSVLLIGLIVAAAVVQARKKQD